MFELWEQRCVCTGLTLKSKKAHLTHRQQKSETMKSCARCLSYLLSSYQRQVRNFLSRSHRNMNRGGLIYFCLSCLLWVARQECELCLSTPKLCLRFGPMPQSVKRVRGVVSSGRVPFTCWVMLSSFFFFFAVLAFWIFRKVVPRKQGRCEYKTKTRCCLAAPYKEAICQCLNIGFAWVKAYIGCNSSTSFTTAFRKFRTIKTIESLHFPLKIVCYSARNYN